MAKDEIFALSDYDIKDKNRRKTFFFLFKTDVYLYQTIRQKFKSTLTHCCEISEKSKSALFAVVYRESRIFCQTAEALITVISIYPFKFSFSYLHCAQDLHLKKQQRKTEMNFFFVSLYLRYRVVLLCKT